MIFAAERNNIIVAVSPELSSDHAEEWFLGLGSVAHGANLVVLDLADGESPSVGDSIDVDFDGSATLRAG